MIDKATFDQIQELNKLPLNQEAYKKLREIGEIPEVDALYVFQLMYWFLKKPEFLLDLNPSKDMALREYLESVILSMMTAKNQKAALDYMILSEDGYAQIEAEMIRELSPEDAAWRLVDLLDMTLRADDRVTNYPLRELS